MRSLNKVAIILAISQAVIPTTVGAEDPNRAGIRFQRIHVEDPIDYPRIYTLLESYITTPELASSINEIQFLPHKFHEISSETCSLLNKDDDCAGDQHCLQRQEEFTRRIDAAIQTITSPNFETDGLISQAVAEHFPFLSEERRHNYVLTLMWMKPEMIEQRLEILDQVRDHPFEKCHFEVLANRKDHEFVYHATALLLLLCPNLERLVYRDNNELNNLVKDTLKRNNYDSLLITSGKKYLENLKDVILLPTDDILFGDERYYIPMDILELMRMFHRLPNINSVSAGGLGSPKEGYLDLFPAETSNLKKVTIIHSHFGSRIVEALVRAPKALEEFTMTTGGRALPGGMSSPTQIKWLGKALQCQKSSLIKLDLDLGTTVTDHEYAWFSDDHDPELEIQNHDRPPPNFTDDEWQDIESRAQVIDEWESQGPSLAMALRSDREYGRTIGSLHDFEQLTHLSIGAELLFGCCCCQAKCREGLPLGVPFRLVDALPPNLKYLLIRGYINGRNSEVDEHFTELSRLRLERFPDLKEIYGIDEFVAGGEHVHHPDRNPHLLWKSEIDAELGWQEVEQQSPVKAGVHVSSDAETKPDTMYRHDEI